MISTVATDALVLKPQAISIHSAKYLSYRNSLIKKKVLSTVNTIKTEITFFAKITQLFKGKEKTLFELCKT